MMNFNKSVTLGLTCGLLLLIALSFHLLYNSPSLGIALEWDLASGEHKVASSKPWSRLKAGDSITGVGGLRVGFLHLQTDNIYIRTRDELLSWFDAKREIFEKLSQPHVSLLVLRDGQEREILVSPRKAGFSFLSNLVFIHLIAGIVVFLIGIIVFNKIGRRKQGLVFLVMSCLIMLIFITNATSLMSEIVYEPTCFKFFNIVNIFCLPLGSAALFHLTLLLPRKRRFLERFPALALLFYGICILIVASLRIPVINALTAILCALSVASVICGFLVEKRPLEKQQMKWVLAGFLFGLGPWVLINAIPMLVIGERLTNDTVSAGFVVFIPLFMAFAIWKYRLMDIDTLFEGTFAYVTTILLLSVVDFGFLGLLNNHFSASQVIPGVFLPLLLVVSLYVVVRDRIRLFVRKVFRRIVLPEADVIASFSRRAKGLAPDGILEALADAVQEAFHIKELRVARRGDTGEDVLKLFHGRTDVVNLWEEPQFSDFFPQRFFVALVMTGGTGAEAVFLLGGLPGRRFYSRRDLAVLKALLAQATAFHENALLYDENFRQRNARLIEEQRHADEKEAIFKDLHDGIGGISANIHLLAELALNSSSPADMKKALSTISGLSQEGISEINTFLQSLDSEDATYETLTAELQHTGNSMLVPHRIDFRLERSGNPGGDARPGRLFSLNVTRIYKEALTNVIKHAKARSVVVRVDFSVGFFTLSIRDDGTGLSEGMTKGQGRGIDNMKKRAKNIGGVLFISAGKGACVELRVPLSCPEAGRALQNGNAAAVS